MWTDRTRWLLLGIAASVLVGHALAYDFVTDDAYISFVYARNLAEHGQLAFNLGHPVEGYTSFLWTVIVGGGMALGVPPELSSRVLATVCAVLVLYVVFRLVERALGRKSLWAVVPAFLLASSSGFACWTSGGLETQLFTLLVVIALDGVVDAVQRPGAIRRAGLALGFAAMTRPEGLLVAGVLGLVHLTSIGYTTHAYRKLPRIRDELIAIVLFLGVWAPWFAWRARYYGHLWPNTYYVKASGPWIDPRMELEMVRNGAHYLWAWLVQTKLLYALPLAALGLVVGRPRTPRFALAMASTLLAASYLTYVVAVGGDFMGLHRFVMPMFVVAAIAVTLGLEWLTGWFRARAVAVVAGALLVGAFGFTQVRLTRASLRWGNFANDRGIDTPAFLIVYTEDRAAIGRAMAPCFRADDFSIVGGAGAQPYYGRMRAIDVFGLVSDRVAHEEPRIRPRAGHTKFASDRLLAEYDPTFVFSCYRIHGAADPQPRLPCAGFWLARGYEQVTLKIPGMRQAGEYYTFLAKKARDFQCPGRVH